MTILDHAPELRTPAPGVDLLCLRDDRFKRAQLLVHFDRPLDARSPARSLLCRVLEQGTARQPSRMHLVRALESLYGADLDLDGFRLAEMHRVSLEISWVGERFLPKGNTVATDALALARELLEEPLRDEGGPPFPLDVLTRERDQLVRQIRSLVDDRSAYAQERFLAEMCAGEPFGRPPYGDEETVAALDGADLEEARADLLARAPVTAFAVGPQDPGPIEAALADWFGGAGPHAEDGPREAVPPPVVRVPEEMRTVREAFEVDQARFLFGFRIPVPKTPEEMERLTMANAVLGGGTSSRLFRVVREERSLAYGISSSLRMLKGILVVEAGIDAGSFEEVRDEVLRQMEAIARGEVQEEELEMARAGVLNDLEAVGDGARSIADFFSRERILGFERTPAGRAGLLRQVKREDLAEVAAGWKPDLVYLLAPEKSLVEVA